jgi:low temperature requirement protein LtrA
VPILRKHTGVRGETHIEVFFDLVYAFANTQLSQFLLNHGNVAGTLQKVAVFRKTRGPDRQRQAGV